MKVNEHYVQRLRTKCNKIADKYLTTEEMIALRMYRVHVFEIAPEYGVLKKLDREIFALGHTLFELLKGVPETLLNEKYEVGRA